MAKLISELSVFFPTFNEEGNIEDVVKSAKKVLEKVADKWEMIIVEDGSTDKTPEISDKVAARDRRIRVVHHRPNRGYGGALKTGFEKAKYEWVAFIDADGQFDFSEITKFIAKKGEADLILGYRKTRADSLARKIFTFGWASLARLILGLKAKDYSCGFKMIKRQAYRAVLPLVGEEKVTQIEMLVKAKKKGLCFAEVGVNHYPRTSGQQKGAKLTVVAKSVIDLFRLWGQMHNVGRREFLILLAIIGVATFLRLFKIDQYMTFLGDEGRDALIVRRLLLYGDPILIGPGTSIGNMYLGPLYYYLMAPALWLAGYSPVGPAVMIALLGVATVGLIWWVGREWLSPLAGLTAAGLYAIAPTVIIYSRSSWNPNIMPFFALLCVYAIWRVWQKSDPKWLVVLGVSYAFVLQSHYLGLLLAPVLAIFWLLALKKRVKKFIPYSLISLLLFLFLMSPLVIFDARHGWNNFGAMKKFFGERQATVSFRPWKAIPNAWPIYKDEMTRLPGGRNEAAGTVLAAVTIGFVVFLLVKRKLLMAGYLPLVIWLSFAVLGLGLYKQHIYDHYYGFFFAAPFILLGGLAEEVKRSRLKARRTILLIALGLLAVVNLMNSPLKSSPNMQLSRTKAVAQRVMELSGGEKFNFAIIAERNYDSAYRYFLDSWGAAITDINPLNTQETITQQLFVVCEMEKIKCDPTHNPKAEVANFGWSRIEGEYEAFGTTIYKLAHTQ